MTRVWHRSRIQLTAWSKDEQFDHVPLDFEDIVWQWIQLMDQLK